MADNILVTPSELRTEAGKIDKIRGEYESQMQQLYKIITSLESRWQGEGQRAYYNHFATVKPTFTKFSKVLEEFAVEMRDYATGMETRDVELARKIKSNTTSFT